MPQLRILTIEDDEQWQRAIKLALRKITDDIVIVSEYEDADRELSRNQFDIITLDMMLSDLEEKMKSTSTGWMILQQIRLGEYPLANDARIIVISGSTDFQDRPDKVAELLTRYNVIGFLWKGSQRWHERLYEMVEEIEQENEKAGPVVFISYSHKDESEKEALLAHLGVLRGGGLIDLWSDDRIGGGADWEEEISKAMAQAQVAILLISANFLTSDFILNKEVPTLLKRRESEGLTVFPVIARACAWKTVDWLARMNVRPKQGRPIWGGRDSYVDEDLSAIAEEVAEIVKK